MRMVTISGVIIFSIVATSVMSYISMATPIGPWIATTIVLFAMLVYKMIPIAHQSQSIAFITIASSIGGILATACGFSYPTLYFLEPDIFHSWLANPIYFCAVLSALAFVAGAFGLLIAHVFEHRLIVEEQLAFPIGQLVYKMIAAGDQIKKAYELMAGFVMTAFFCLLQDGIMQMQGIIPKAVTLIPTLTWRVVSVPLIRFDLWPMLWAIGFVTGHVIAVPLAVGAFARIVLIDTTYEAFFSHLTAIEFSVTFCTGIVLYGLVMSFIPLPQMLLHGVRWLKKNGWYARGASRGYTNDRSLLAAGGLVVAGNGIFLHYFHFSLASMAFLLVGSFACVYQIMVIAGKIGLAPLGRFATFVMIPALLLFGLNMVQTVMVATFVEICGGVAADVLFGRKIAHLMHLDRKKVVAYQALGLLVSSFVVGIVFFFLIKHFGLGSAQLFAYKAQSRALQIAVQQFDYWAMLLGALFSLGLKYLKVNPMLVLGGILMPINISLGLIFGGLLTACVKDREEWEPFWSGVFASNSIWMLVRAMIG